MTVHRQRFLVQRPGPLELTQVGEPGGEVPQGAWHSPAILATLLEGERLLVMARRQLVVFIERGHGAARHVEVGAQRAGQPRLPLERQVHAPAHLREVAA